MLNYHETPIQEINTALLSDAGVRLLIKREDLNHPEISGNKWWKLKYNLQEAVRLGHHTLLTFGGAYSNHIFATAAAAHELGLKSIGIIRGEETMPLNHTLAFAKGKGMQLYYVSREAYRHKTETEFIKRLEKQCGNFYLIPEGGTNELAVKGCAEFAEKTHSEINFDYLCVPVGTGGTMSGMIKGIDDSKKILGFSSLKGRGFLEVGIKKLLKHQENNWRLITDYHFGGHAKATVELVRFTNQMNTDSRLPLDPVYTAKMMFGIFDLVKKGYFEKGSTLLAVHTGGLQGKLMMTMKF